MGKTTNDNVIKVAIVESADYYGFALLDVAALLVENDEFVIPCLISPEEAISKLRDIRTELDSCKNLEDLPRGCGKVEQ